MTTNSECERGAGDTGREAQTSDGAGTERPGVKPAYESNVARRRDSNETLSR
jgi:hypothetical protein